jgi:outer membrane protein insertion porin family
MKIINTILLALLISVNSFADIVNDLDVSGNKRISKESIAVFGNIKLNQDYSTNDLNKVLKNLYETNFFENIQMNIKNKILYINVVENPIIEHIYIEGVKNKKFEEYLLSSLNLKSRNSYIESIFENDIISITNTLKQSGYYFSKVEPIIEKNDEQNSIVITYNLVLGEKAKIDQIVFLGDKKIKSRKLKNIITSEEAKFWKFISKQIFIDKERINLDKRLLTNYYRNKGYYNVKVEDSFVEFKDNNAFKLIFTINAGEKFEFNNVDLIIPDDYDPKHFKSIDKFLKKIENKQYSLNKIDKILKEIDKIALSKQYEFVNAKMSEKIIDKNKLDILITLEETEKFYIEKINVLGNQYTLEEVIRNTFIVDEGDAYNEILFNKSLNNLKARNLFKSVTNKIKDGSNENLKVIDVRVEEKPTGEISLGAGVGTSGGTLGGGVRENNFLGKGITLDTSLSLTENSVKGKFVYSKPNFAYTDNTLFTSLESSSEDNILDNGYKTSNIGFALSTRFEQYDGLFFRPEIAMDIEKLQTTSKASTSLKKQHGNYFDTYFNYTLDYDQRNQKFQTSEGYRTVFYQGLPIASEQYEIINSFEVSKYKKLISDMIGKINFYSKAVNSMSGKDVRISKRAYIPQSKLRGFEAGKVGPIDNDDFIGGNYVTAVNLSTTLPQILPSFENTDFSFFLDAANIWGVDHSSTAKEHNTIRSSVGVGVDFLTPVGPLSFSLTQPISKASSDKTETFRFNLGTSF